MKTKTFAGLEFFRDYSFVGDVIAFTSFANTTVEKLQDALLEVVDMYPFGPAVWVLSAYDEDDKPISVTLTESDDYFFESLVIERDLEEETIYNLSAYNEVRKKHYV